jgi:hypothetical protein
MDKVSIRENITFKSVDGTALALDLYTVAGGGAKPAVVLVSGGLNVRGWGLYKGYGRIVGASDVVAVIPDKRYRGPQGIEQGAQDTLDLLAHLLVEPAAAMIIPQTSPGVRRVPRSSSDQARRRAASATVLDPPCASDRGRCSRNVAGTGTEFARDTHARQWSAARRSRYEGGRSVHRATR